jgi:SAM-dependent methyltransferase
MASQETAIEPARRLPYCDVILDGLQNNDRDFLHAFGRHLHWGFWEAPEAADGSVEDFASAADRLCNRLLAAASIAGGHRVLDAGCGIGGTLANLNETLSAVSLYGINIDERQVARAAAVVLPRPGNALHFVHGDACRLPFASEAFDRVLAVECIFHFPSRRQFFAEARRVLRRGGKLALSDFVPAAATSEPPDPQKVEFARRVAEKFGPMTAFPTLDEYRQLARETGFEVTVVDDVTPGLVPSFKVVRKLLERAGREEMAWATDMIEAQLRQEVSRYVILAFEATTPTSAPASH